MSRGLAILFVPFVPGLFPFPVGAIVMMVLNLSVLVVTWLAHMRYLREARPSDPGE